MDARLRAAERPGGPGTSRGPPPRAPPPKAPVARPGSSRKTRAPTRHVADCEEDEIIAEMFGESDGDLGDLIADEPSADEIDDVSSDEGCAPPPPPVYAPSANEALFPHFRCVGS